MCNKHNTTDTRVTTTHREPSTTTQRHISYTTSHRRNISDMSSIDDLIPTPPEDPKLIPLMWGHVKALGSQDDPTQYNTWESRITNAAQTIDGSNSVNIYKGLTAANASAPEKKAAFHFLQSIILTGQMLGIALDPTHLDNGYSLLSAIRTHYQAAALQQKERTDARLKEYLTTRPAYNNNGTPMDHNHQLVDHQAKIMRALSKYNTGRAPPQQGQNDSDFITDKMVLKCFAQPPDGTRLFPYMTQEEIEFALTCIADRTADGRYTIKDDATINNFFASAKSYHERNREGQQLAQQQPMQPRGGGQVLQIDKLGDGRRKSDVPCKFFRRTNKCADGDECPFSHATIITPHQRQTHRDTTDKQRHDESDRAANHRKPAKHGKQPPSTYDIKEMRKEVCNNFLNGRCTWGTRCYRQHPQPNGTPPDKRRNKTTDNTNTTMCARYLAGQTCSGSCGRKHDPELRSAVQRQFGKKAVHKIDDDQEQETPDEAN